MEEHQYNMQRKWWRISTALGHLKKAEQRAYSGREAMSAVFGGKRRALEGQFKEAWQARRTYLRRKRRG